MYRIYILFFDKGELIKRSITCASSLEHSLLKSYYILRDFEKKRLENYEKLRNVECKLVITEDLEIDFDDVKDFKSFEEKINKYLTKEYFNKVYYVYSYSDVDFTLDIFTSDFEFRCGHYPQYLEKGRLVFSFQINQANIEITDDIIRKLSIFLSDIFNLKRCIFKLNETYIAMLIDYSRNIRARISIKYRSDRDILNLVINAVEKFVYPFVFFVKSSEFYKILPTIIKNKNVVNDRDFINFMESLDCSCILIDAVRDEDLIGIYFNDLDPIKRKNRTIPLTLVLKKLNDSYIIRAFSIDTEKVKDLLEYIKTLIYK